MCADQKTFRHRIFDIFCDISSFLIHMFPLLLHQIICLYEEISPHLAFRSVFSLSMEVGYAQTACWMESTQDRQISGELPLSVLGQHLSRKVSIPASRSARCCHKHMIIRHCAICKDITVSRQLLVTCRYLQRLGGYLDSRKLPQP